MKIFRLILIWFLLGLFLTAGILPGRSQIPQSHLANAQNLVQQGKKYYQAEQFSAAVNNLQQAADTFAALGEEQKEAITRGNLSLAYQRLGNWQETQAAIAKSLALLNFKYDLDTPQTWQISELDPEKRQILARIINIYGRLRYLQGDADNALSSWQLATNIYQQLEDRQGIVTNQINQIQALQTLGLYQEATKIGKTVEQNLDHLPDNLKFQVLLSLGNVYRSVGDLANSEKYLQASLKLAKNSNSSKNISNIQLSLADTWHSWGNLERERLLPIRYEYIPWRCDRNVSLSLPQKAQELYDKAENKYRQMLEAERSQFSTTAIKAQLNLLKLLITNGQWSKAQTLSQKIKLSDLPNNRTKVYSQINDAKSLACIKQHYSPEDIAWNKITRLIETAIHDTEGLQDKRAKSYAIGNLGGLYEYLALLAQQQQQKVKAQQWIQQAQQLTQRALYLAQPSQLPDIAYQWQWQLGRLLEAQGKTRESIAYYQSAIQTLESVRGDLLTINSDVQFSFRDNIEPVYRQLAQLLLQQPIPNLAQTLQIIKNLQLAELENYLRCNIKKTQALDKIVNRTHSTEAVIYPIILDEQIDVILKLPHSDELQYHNNKLFKGEVVDVLQRLQDNLAKPHTKKKVQADAGQIYQWLIAPFAVDLERAKVDTLVFFLDTPLRNIPMAVLYDGKNYLIEKYAVAVTSGLELREPKTLQREQLNAMLAGLTESRQGYPPLKNVDLQLNQISAEIPSQILLDREFTVSSFQNQLQSLPFSVVHIATHGQFSSQPEETFIIAWDNRINVNELSNFLKSRQETESEPIELLVLAACQTAKGDKRATLGLAGVAINAGARSTLATLWKVSADESPGDLLGQFYRELSANPHLTKAEALRRAQLEFLKDDSRNRPYFWAPYILLGNWL
ncbi:CHAT domain-containing protein [Pleurocapsa sp. PCC 7319]|uniref:CHAT domain-containing protein n=1 Tax=Pleurocapsa sp. PCC 7319 TaxID=118161 RepID=UPI00034983EC|nr:CHAT domain-containing protein [Pleurocapsa sp. PCC 7319]